MKTGKDRGREEGELSGDDSSLFDFEDLIDEFMGSPDVNEEEDDDCVFFGEEDVTMSSEEYSHYLDQVRESEGFDIDHFTPQFFTDGLIIPTLVDRYSAQLTEFAINKQGQGKNLKLVRVVKWNREYTNPVNYYITFEAEDLNTGGVETYQTKVVLMVPEVDSEVPGFGESQVLIFRVRKSGQNEGNGLTDHAEK